MESLIIHPKSEEQINLFEQMAKALKIPFEKKNLSESPYSPEFVQKVKKAETEAKAGKSTQTKPSDIWNLG